MIGTMAKRSDEAIDIELDQKYVMAREIKKGRFQKKKEEKKYRSQSIYPVLHQETLYSTLKLE